MAKDLRRIAIAAAVAGGSLLLRRFLTKTPETPADETRVGPVTAAKNVRPDADADAVISPAATAEARPGHIPDEAEFVPVAETRGVSFTDEDSRVSLGDVEAAMRSVEKVRVTFCHADGKDAHSARLGFKPYRYQYKLNDDYTVSDLIGQRLIPGYEEHGLKPVVKYANGEIAHGGTRLGTVRESYELD